MENSNNLFIDMCSYENLELAFKKARKRKSLKFYVIEFEKDLENNLLKLRSELIFHTYKPKPLETFIIRDPKTRKISKSDFRDRIVHHALCNIIEPIFDKGFIHDSYANRKNKGTLKAIERFDYFKRKVSRNNSKHCWTLKADIKHYFETVNHDILLSIIKKKVPDKRILWLVRVILSNHKLTTSGGGRNIGMPLGNLTSQFFANVYLDELDQFIKHKLKVTSYIRYVDDFVLLHSSKDTLENYSEKINSFLKQKLKLELHPEKSRIIQLNKGLPFLGFRIFYYHKLLKKTNKRRILGKIESYKELSDRNKLIYDKLYESLQGAFAYMKHANTYKLRKSITTKFEKYFPNEVSAIEVTRLLKTSNK